MYQSESLLIVTPLTGCDSRGSQALEQAASEGGEAQRLSLSTLSAACEAKGASDQ